MNQLASIRRILPRSEVKLCETVTPLASSPMDTYSLPSGTEWRTPPVWTPVSLSVSMVYRTVSVAGSTLQAIDRTTNLLMTPWIVGVGLWS